MFLQLQLYDFENTHCIEHYIETFFIFLFLLLMLCLRYRFISLNIKGMND